MQERFTITAANASGRWIATDRLNGICITFEAHRFNDTQEVTTREDTPADPINLARAMREIGDWLAVNHPDKVF